VSLDRAVEDGRRVAATDELFDAYCSRLVTAEAALFAFLVTRAVVGLATATDAAVVVQAATPTRSEGSVCSRASRARVVSRRHVVDPHRRRRARYPRVRKSGARCPSDPPRRFRRYSTRRPARASRTARRHVDARQADVTAAVGEGAPVRSGRVGARPRGRCFGLRARQDTLRDVGFRDTLRSIRDTLRDAAKAAAGRVCKRVRRARDTRSQSTVSVAQGSPTTYHQHGGRAFASVRGNIRRAAAHVRVRDCGVEAFDNNRRHRISV
jgi:hypothetical protein